MDFKLFEYFLSTQGVWAILFVFTFLYVLNSIRLREKERKEEQREFEKKLENDIKLIHANNTFITNTYKLLLEKELKKRRNEK